MGESSEDLATAQQRVRGVIERAALRTATIPDTRPYNYYVEC